ncbi:hypothetical protein [Mesorhizobium sp. B2-5-9]|nr:hypothetical protein [Mesorhizobium sp. B2-5-9]
MISTYHLADRTSPDEISLEAFCKSYGYAIIEWARVEDTHHHG